MHDSHAALSQFLEPNALENTAFPPTSRYHGIAVKTMERADGQQVAYLGRRFLPPIEQQQVLQEHTVVQGDRIDNLAAHYVGVGEKFWLIADANPVLDPQQLTAEVGRRIRIAAPEGIPGVTTSA